MSADIIIAIQQGDASVFEALYNAHRDRLYFWFLGKTRSEYLAEELLQQTFIKIWSARAGLNPALSFDVQLFRTGRSLMIDLLRKRASERRMLDTITRQQNEAISFDSTKETQTIIDRTIGQLHPTGQKVFRLSREEGLSYAQISEALAISQKTVEYHISKALQLLRKSLLSGRFFFFL